MAKCPKCQTNMEDGSRFCPECGHQMQDVVMPDVAAGLMTLGGLETLDDTVTRDSKSSQIPALEPGAVFAGRYTIEKVVGRGGMGVVYRAMDALAKKIVALKLIRPERLTGTNAIDRLISEGITARDIRHSNVVAVYDVGTDEGQPFVSMEYLDGPSLRSWHRGKVQAREDVPLNVAARIISEILDGLKAAHAAGVIHRDLKPENIVLMGEPTEDSAPLKILDFGIARAAGAALESGTGTGLGTPRYMAPEQITNPDAAGPSADLYSLSVLFYELLVDVLPQGHWQPPSGGRSDVPTGIDKLIELGLSNRPANRPQSAEDYKSELATAIGWNKGTRKKKVENGRRWPWETLDKPTVLKLAAATAAVFIGVSLFYLFSPQRSECDGLSGDSYRLCVGLPLSSDIETNRLAEELENERRRADQADAIARAAARKAQEETDKRAEAERLRLEEEARKRNQNRYAYLSGRWNLDDGTYYNVGISSSGSFSGSGYASDGTAVTIRGSLSGNSGSYTSSAPAYNISVSGTLRWDGACHINWQANGGAGQVHVKHNPGVTVCPS